MSRLDGPEVGACKANRARREREREVESGGGLGGAAPIRQGFEIERVGAEVGEQARAIRANRSG